MKRLADLPLIVKMGFAPLLALIALMVVTGIGFVAQKQQSAALQRVAEQEVGQVGSGGDTTIEFAGQRGILAVEV